MSNNCTVYVRGYPTNLAPERVADKLMIHFLRARNGGGDIINIEFTPETSDCAMITFEDAAVAQRVLKAQNHVLSVSGENYPLEVAAYPTKLNPDQIFVYVHMKIDYGSFPKGQEVLCRLFKQYKGIYFTFNSQKMVCSVKGTFTELQDFSSELLRSLSSKQRGSISEVNRRRPAARRDVASQQVETEEDNKKAVGGPLSIQNSLGNLTEPLEDFSLVIDSDVYLYMQRFCGEKLRKILTHSQVGVVDVNSEGVTTLYLQATLDGDEAMRALVSARRAISELSEQLEATLRKEKITKSDLGVDGLRTLPGELQTLYPQVLCHEDHEHLYFIGDLMDISLAKQHVEKFIAARGMSQDCQKDDAFQPSHLPVIHKRSAVPGQLKSSEEPVRKMNSPEPSGKTGHKLAAKFNSNPSLPSYSSLGVPSVLKFPGSLPADYQSPNSELPFLAVAASESKSQMGEYQKAPQGVKINPSQAMQGDTVSKSEGFTSLPFKGPSSLHVDSSLRSLNLLDTTGAVDCQNPEPGPLLRRSHSFSWQEPLYSSESTSKLQQLEAKDSVNHLQKKAQEKIHPTSRKEVSQEKMAQKEKACEVESQNAHLLAVQRGDGKLSGTQRVENLTKFPDYIYESFSYSELGMEGPEDEALTDLCNYLKGCQDKVLVRRDRYKLDLVYPCEAKVKIQEALKVSFTQRKATLDKQLHSHEVQLGGSVDMSSTESQSIQPLTESSKTSWRESPPVSGSPARWKLPSQVQGDSAAQRLLVQGFANDREAGQSKSLSQIPDGSKQGLLGKVVPEGLPLERHFVQDHSQEEWSGETGMAPQSRPLLLPSASDSVPLEETVKRYPPAGEAVASDLHQQAASPGRETHNGECQVCQSGPSHPSHSPCYQTLGRKCYSAENTSSSNVCASPAISGTFTFAVLSQSVPGYYRYPTLKLIYDIPDGVQQTGHPRPGHLYRGGRFEAYLPDTKEGRQLMVLLSKAFECNLTFQIQSCASEERVTWGTLPHKTAMEKGKDRNGYPDAQYLQNLRLKLKDLGIE